MDEQSFVVLDCCSMRSFIGELVRLEEPYVYTNTQEANRQSNWKRLIVQEQSFIMFQQQNEELKY